MQNLTGRSVAFKKGHHDGYEEGVEFNPYENGNNEWREYRIGYDAGVADYCEEQEWMTEEGEE